MRMRTTVATPRLLRKPWTLNTKAGETPRRASTLAGDKSAFIVFPRVGTRPHALLAPRRAGVHGAAMANTACVADCGSACVTVLSYLSCSYQRASHAALLLNYGVPCLPLSLLHCCTVACSSYLFLARMLYCCSVHCCAMNTITHDQEVPAQGSPCHLFWLSLRHHSPPT